MNKKEMIIEFVVAGSLGLATKLIKTAFDDFMERKKEEKETDEE